MGKTKNGQSIKVNIPEEEKFLCRECGQQFKSIRGITGHVQRHKIKYVDYLVKYYMNGIRPTCHLEYCNNETNYTQGYFKKYCPEHRKEAKSDWAKNNPSFDFGWKRGLTKEDHPGIASQAQKISGENNAFYGVSIHDSLTEEQKEKKRSNQKMKEVTYKRRIAKIKKEKNMDIITPHELYQDNRAYNIEANCLDCGYKDVFSLFDLNLNKHPCRNCIDKSHSEETKKKLSDIVKFSEEDFLYHCNQQQEFDVLTPYSEYTRQNKKLKVKCKTCENETKRTLSQLREGTLCWSCNGRSKDELEVLKIFGDEEVIRNTRNVISPYELDFYLPQHNLAVEYNGLYWHCELNKSKDYHKQKTEQCRAKDIQLFHIFSDEWREKRDIITSMLLYRTNKIKNKKFARKLKIKELKTSTRRSFFESNHVAGDVSASVAFGLYDGTSLMCAVSLRKPHQKKKYEGTIEIARFATRLNMVVVGGFGKLLKRVEEWSRENGYERILTYADLRFGDGDVYALNGFEDLGDTVLDYWYTNGVNRFNRFKYRAKDGRSEREIAEENYVYKIYGCGSRRYEKSLI